MTETAHSDPRPYLSVVAWPQGFERDEVARLLAEAGVLDLPTLRMRLGQDPRLLHVMMIHQMVEQLVTTFVKLHFTHLQTQHQYFRISSVNPFLFLKTMPL